jgi:D-psicose/D-tagatose/L-ribulose 3-epimerase
MKFGMNMLLWTTHVTEAHWPELDRLQAMGYDHIEIPIFRLDRDHFAKIGRRLDALGLGRSAVTVRTAVDNPISADPQVRAAAVTANRLAIDCCQALGARTLAGPYHSAIGVFTNQPPTPEEWRWGIEAMRPVADHAAACGIELALEFLNRFECYLLNTTADTARFVQEVGAPNIGVLYDTHHANIEEKDVTAAIGNHARLINHIHVSENDRSTPGKGQVQWGATFDALKRAGYDDVLVVEAFGQSLPELLAATKIWRKMFDSEDQLAGDALDFMKSEWAKRG